MSWNAWEYCRNLKDSQDKDEIWLFKALTRRERLKSALYLRLKKRKVFKIVKGGTLSTFRKSSSLQNIKKLKGGPLKTFKKIENFLKQSHSAGKVKRGDPLGFLKLQFAPKYQKTWRGTLWRQKNREKSQCRKNSKEGPCNPVRFAYFVKEWVHEKVDPLH